MADNLNFNSNYPLLALADAVPTLVVIKKQMKFFVMPLRCRFRATSARKKSRKYLGASETV